jgi:hypothetical protein
MFNGEKVASASQWFNQRRPELKLLFQHYMYGTLPPAPKTIHFDVERVDHTMFGGKATKKEIGIRFSDDTNAPVIQLLLVVPNARKSIPVSAQPDATRQGFGASELISRSPSGPLRRS